MSAPTPSRSDVLGLLAQSGVVPIIVIDDASSALRLGEALVEGGLGAVEVTFRTPAAPAALAAMSNVEGLLVGAGTVTSLEQVDRAADGGARFVVSTGFDAELVQHARSLGLLALPGVATASEAQAACRIGLSAVKLFPISQLGGPGFVTALAGPFPSLSFFPSGGITVQNAATYLEHPAVFAVGGGWVAPRQLIAEKGFESIAESAATACALVRSRA